MKASPNFEGFQVRKSYTHMEDTRTDENGRHPDGALLLKVVIGAAILDPFADCSPNNLSEVVNASPTLGHAFMPRIKEILVDDKVESCGKACVVGLDGEYERSNAFLTSLFADAPNADEVVIALAFASGGRLHARLGGTKTSEIKGQDGLY
ncbi:amino acid synthesis family protein [Paraburkholderia dipogonis]|uniref:Amino acid synthesis family protein n=1 Tax=Paraburkholderia dipogonis TaxID=1211383 RepID=A0A4Y8MJA6_9BURK|nr:amino acid synthesis family protein [Paraburkholderia dipogonis]TFE37560.1 amino acid synthesis family protein [Paraburkholderia dipogonis]